MEAPVLRTVARIEFPSTNDAMTLALSIVLRRFMLSANCCQYWPLMLIITDKNVDNVKRKMLTIFSGYVYNVFARGHAMTERIYARGSTVRQYILENVEKNPTGITTQTAKHFKISRQAAYRHLKNLIAEKALTPVGTTRNVSYKICSQVEWQTQIPIVPGLA